MTVMKSLIYTLGLATAFTACTPTSDPVTTLIHDEMTIAELHALYEEGSLSSTAAVEFYLDRIEAINGGDIDLNAVLWP